MVRRNVLRNQVVKMVAKDSYLLTLAVAGKATTFTRQFLRVGRNVRLRDVQLTLSGCRIRIWWLEWGV
jgi:hypothetical protein